MFKKTIMIVALVGAGLVPLTTTLSNDDSLQMYMEFNGLVHNLNAQGRLPLQGVSGGLLNNVWQTTTHHNNPGQFGCSSQAEYIRDELRIDFPDWSFLIISESGFKSPILLPHTWVRAYGPHGAVIDIDPWSYSFQVRS